SVDTVEMVDAPTHVSISKKIKSTDIHLAGAELCITDKNGKVIDTWYSETTPHVVQGLLIAGEQYTLKEIKAPSGYGIASAITFSVDLHAKNIELNMYDVLSSSQLPETSDSNQLYSWIALFVESGIILLLVLLLGKLRKKRV
ncbi:MAG TPA: prealbumin-like fold domain-containing protein, partial [Candidatus Limiplasma sp.]|nr:prealbumin-like fold domain-containing protein [Candidatus Limiplasma sp.]